MSWVWCPDAPVSRFCCVASYIPFWSDGALEVFDVDPVNMFRNILAMLFHLSPSQANNQLYAACCLLTAYRVMLVPVVVDVLKMLLSCRPRVCCCAMSLIILFITRITPYPGIFPLRCDLGVAFEIVCDVDAGPALEVNQHLDGRDDAFFIAAVAFVFRP